MNRTTAISLSSVIPEKAKLLSGTHTLKPVIPEDAKPPKAVIPEEAQPLSGTGTHHSTPTPNQAP